MKGLFITVEGPEGSGKTTQCHYLAQWLESQGYAVLLTREPGGTPTAEAIRHILLRTASPGKTLDRMTPACETALILAARSQHITHVIIPALQTGYIVLCDRFFDSTLAYQGYGRGLNKNKLAQFNEFVTDGLKPRLTLLLDLPVKEGLLRRKRTRRENRLDQETLAFHERVRQGYLSLASQAPRRWRTFDARQPAKLLAQDIRAAVQILLTGTRLQPIPSASGSPKRRTPANKDQT